MAVDYLYNKQINYVERDITTVERGVVVHGVNCQGRMGSGVALAIRNKWPNAYDKYIELCEQYQDKSQLLNMSQFVHITDELYVGNLFTQVYYGYDGKKYADLQAVKKTLEDAVLYSQHMDLPMYMPKIAAKRGGLDWDRDIVPVVHHLVNKYHSVPITVYVA